MDLSSFKFSWWAPKDACVWDTVRYGPSRSSNVVDFGTDRKRACDFLLVVNSNLGPIFPRYRDIAGFLLRRATPPLFHPNFGVPLRLDCWCCGSRSRSEDLKLTIHVIHCELSQDICKICKYVTDGRMDRQAGGRTTCYSNTALCSTCIAQ